jgi:hypothetical protein
VIAQRFYCSAFAILCVVCAGAAWAGGPDRAPSWGTLTAVQRQALAPLQHDWPAIDSPRKQKWLEVAARFPAMPADERIRVQERMAEWARMSPGERTRARLQFQEAQQLPADQRQAHWQAYQALSDDERRTLAQRAKPPSKGASASELPTRARPVADAASGRRNVVQAAPAGRTAAPAVVHAKPGATTTTVSARATPPPHHQPGLPKIAATQGFVDPATLLPRRGPQGAAVRSAAASEPAAQP